MGKTFEIKDGDVSDGYHTFDELYEHRCLLFLAWVVSDGRPGNAYWVADHFDGWDLVVCDMKGKQISYHVPIRYRPILKKHLDCLSLEHHKWDGHTSQDVVNRITEWLTKD